MNIQSKLLLALLATSSAAFAQTAPAAPESTLGYNVGVASEYRYRAIGQSKGEPALQGGVDYADKSGFYVGAWGSTIKWIKDVGGDANVELDLYGGYKGAVGDVAYDVGFQSLSHFNRSFRRITNESPTEFRSRLKLASQETCLTA